jgi:hypothetical protein
MHLRRIHTSRRLVIVASAIVAVAVPAGLAQAQVSSGTDAYVEQVPTSTGTKVTNTPKQQATPRPATRPQHTYHPRPAYTPPRSSYVAPSAQRTTPSYRPRASAPAPKPRHARRAHRRRHHAAAAAPQKQAAAPAKVPAVPAGVGSGGDHSFTWLAAFMLVVTGAVLAGAHVQRRRPVLRADV